MHDVLLRTVSEDVADSGTEKQVKPGDDQHHERHKDEHDQCVTAQFFAGPRDGAALYIAIHLGARDDVLTGFVS